MIQDLQEKTTECHEKQTDLNELELELKATSKEKQKIAGLKAQVDKTLMQEQVNLERLQEKQQDLLNTSQENDDETPNLPDFSTLPEDALDIQDEKEYSMMLGQYDERIMKLTHDIEQMQPNMKALERYDEIQQRIVKEEAELEEMKAKSNQAANEFERIKTARYERFMEAFTHVSNSIDTVYKKLTKSVKHTLGGTAYLSLDNTQEPYLHGIRYNVMPPMKRFRPMEHLSGGEKTVAALALLFAIHSYSPSPFFVLDEVDAALDNVNVNKVSTFIQQCEFQCVVISLKDIFYEKADALVGICKDIQTQQSKSYTLNLIDQYG